MAIKSVYQEFDQTALTYFGLESAPVYGVLSSSDLCNVDSVICIKDPDKYDRLSNILSTETIKSTWKTHKRAFVLPKCPVSLDRVKSIAKEHNITIVNDYQKADFIISHDEISKELQNSETIQSTLLLVKLWNYDTLTDTNGKLLNVDNSNMTCIYDEKWNKACNSWNCNTVTLYDAWLITGMALNIAHNLETNILHGVVDINSFMHSAINSQEITEDLLKNIKQMMSSYNDEDKEIVSKIIPTIDNSKQHHLLWQLFEDVGNLTYSFNRNKDVQYWLQNLKYEYNQCSAEQMLLQLDRDNLLTKESFKYLEPICRKEIKISNRALYVFNVSIIPKFEKYIK